VSVAPKRFSTHLIWLEENEVFGQSSLWEEGKDEEEKNIENHRECSDNSRTREAKK